MLPAAAAARAALGMGDGWRARRPNGQSEADPLQFSGAAITGVWAEENTRESIFAGLKRKETFATSGVRIRLRMFGSWRFSPEMMKTNNWVAGAYADGVPMGSDLPVNSGADPTAQTRPLGPERSRRG